MYWIPSLSNFSRTAGSSALYSARVSTIGLPPDAQPSDGSDSQKKSSFFGGLARYGRSECGSIETLDGSSDSGKMG
jgi:hypothetical protein